MKLKERLEQIKQLETIETPWHVSRIFGHLSLFGSQVTIQNNGDSDYVELQEFQQALQWLVEQFGGKVSWAKDSKKEQKK